MKPDCHEAGAPTWPECADSNLIHFGASRVCCDDLWEAAYLRFETAEQEIAKFIRRLRVLGADRWPRDAQIVELFCGRGNGLHALGCMGFERIEGVDLSASLLTKYKGPAHGYVGDCRDLPFEERSKDIVIVQGGLHHLPALPGDLDRTLSEARRVLRDGGLFLAVEPWKTPFLVAAHAACASRIARRIVPKVDALAQMIEHERPTYEAWLGQPRAILDLLGTHFSTVRRSIAWGKLAFVGQRVPG